MLERVGVQDGADALVSGEFNPDVNLMSTLESGEFTVFALVDDAFGKIDPAS